MTARARQTVLERERELADAQDELVHVEAWTESLRTHRAGERAVGAPGRSDA